MQGLGGSDGIFATILAVLAIMTLLAMMPITTALCRFAVRGCICICSQSTGCDGSSKGDNVHGETCFCYIDLKDQKTLKSMAPQPLIIP